MTPGTREIRPGRFSTAWAGARIEAGAKAEFVVLVDQPAEILGLTIPPDLQPNIVVTLTIRGRGIEDVPGCIFADAPHLALPKADTNDAVTLVVENIHPFLPIEFRGTLEWEARRQDEAGASET